MSRYYERNDSGYTRGGLDVVTGINLFFKGILIFPILVLATYLGLAMVKHMIFQGVPSMNSPTEEQRQELIDRDAQISTGVPISSAVSPYELPQLPQLPGVTDGTSVTPAPTQYRHGVSAEHYNTDTLQQPVEESWITTIEEDPFQ